MFRTAFRAALVAAAQSVGGRSASPGSANDVAAPGGRRKATRRSRGRTSPLPVSVTRWVQRDVESAYLQASQGDMQLAGQLYRGLRRDGMAKGLMKARFSGLVRLPRRFSGDPDAKAFWEGSRGKPGAFNRVFVSSELALLAADHDVLGVGVGELVDIEGSPLPMFVRLEPEFLIYRPWEDQWYYRTFNGLERVCPGDGRWVLHVNGRMEPWNNGDWQALARAYIAKEHAIFARENWNNKLANPARVALAPLGATDEQKMSWYQKVMAWGINSVFGLTPGYDVKLLESNGRGYESFVSTIKDSDGEIIVILTGSKTLVDGGSGFSNDGVQLSIRNDMIADGAEALARTLNEQALPFAVPEGALPPWSRAEVSWDSRPAADRKKEAESLSASAKAMDECIAVLEKHGLPADKKALAQRFLMPVLDDLNGDGVPDNDAPQLPGEPAARLPMNGKTGLEAIIEIEAGETRYGVGPDGQPWSTVMQVAYGYLRGTTGADGEPVDAYFGPHEGAPVAWVVEQLNPDGSPDERKVLLWFRDAETAVSTFKAHVPAWACGPVREVPVAELRDYLRSCGDRAMRWQHAA